MSYILGNVLPDSSGGENITQHLERMEEHSARAVVPHDGNGENGKKDHE